MFLLYIILRVSAMIIVHYAEQNKSEILALDKHSRAYYNIVEQSLNYLTKERTTLAESEMKCACEVIHEETVREVERKLSDKDEYIELASLFKMFGDGTRVQILHALELHEMCVCDLAALLGITKSAVSSAEGVEARESREVPPRRSGSVLLTRRRPCERDTRHRLRAYPRKIIPPIPKKIGMREYHLR